MKSESQKLTSQPRGVAVAGDKVVIACHKSIIVFQKGKLASDFNIKYEGFCTAISPNGNLVAVGGSVSSYFIITNKGCIYRIAG